MGVSSVVSLILASYLLFINHVTEAKPPHIVFIVADDLGWNDVGWHNPQMITPNLDKLAKSGVILNSSYVQPVCSPSRSSFMTGYYPFHTGLQHYVIIPDCPAYLRSNYTLLPQKLNELGYVSHMVGKWHLGFCNWKYTPTYRGFESYMGFLTGAEDYYKHTVQSGYDFRFNKKVYHPPKGEYSANTFSQRAIDIIKNFDQKSNSLFLYLPFQSVHAPLEVPKRFEDMYSHIQHRERRLYCGMVSALDEAVGNITDALTKYGFMENLLIVFTTDNGGPTYLGANNLPLRGAKTTLWEGGTKGSAFVYSKTLVPKTGYTNTEKIHAVDWFPTLLSVAGGSPDPNLDGTDQWMTVSKGQPSRRNEFIYNIDDISKNAAIRVGDFKLIEGSPGKYNGWYPLPTTPYSCPPVTDFYGNLLEEELPQLQLFNIKDDPGEHNDLALMMPDVVAKLKDRLDYYKQTMVPSFFPPPDPKSNPKYYNGTWSPGWC